MESTRDPNRAEYHYSPTARPKRNYSWLPLLLLPLFFVFGWFANEATAPNQTTNNPNPQYGVGGGPGDVTPFPSATVTTDDSDLVEITPSVTATPRATAEKDESTTRPSPSSTSSSTIDGASEEI